jgi:thioredoxin reductase (NADPH)
MHDLIIIGGGPAALSAAVYALGKQLDVKVIYEKLGGKAGTQQHLHGQSAQRAAFSVEAAHLLEREIAAQPEHTVCDRVSSVTTIEGGFRIVTQDHGTYQSRAVIVATGTTPRMLDLPGARELLGQGIGYSATTHAHLVAGKQVAVIGTTARALRGAAELARTAARVYLIAPDAAGLDTPLAHTLQQRPNLEALAGYQVKAVNGPFNVESVVVERGDEHRWLRVDAAFVDLGLIPNSSVVRQLVRLDPAGFIWVDERNATTLAGLFAAGDVTIGFGEQVLIAIGDGARAALSAYEYLLAHAPGV